MMGLNNSLFKKFAENKTAKQIFFTVTALKLIGFAFFKYLGGEFWVTPQDANVYDTIARGVYIFEHPWGGFLKKLNSIGYYSRSVIATLIFMLNCTLVPWLIYKICFSKQQILTAINWYVLLLAAVYPTMTIFSADIFRDTPMVVFFLMFVLGAGYFLSNPICQWTMGRGVCWLIVLIISGYILYALRFYLAVALFIAMALAFASGFCRSWWLHLSLYLGGLSVANWFGIFDQLKGVHRNSYAGAGSVYGIDFSQGIFLVNFLQSFVYSIFGVYIYNTLSALVFVVESVPMLMLAAYIFLNRCYGNRYISFFLFFFFTYAALWIIGTDSLGTAVRYRIFNYLAILVAVSLVYQEVQSGARLHEN